ncbi:MAG: hypothetical protein U0269_09885 [Polyangiales bacterium]
MSFLVRASSRGFAGASRRASLRSVASAALFALAHCALPHAAFRTDAEVSDGTLADGPCGAGFVRCGTQCVSINVDPSNCGACGNGCSVANAVARCTGGACGVERCLDGFGDCDNNAANGCETRLDSTDHCGACGRRCDGSTPNCDALTRACVTGCSPQQTRCQGACVNLLSDPSNCGSCSNACSLPNATAGCSAGACVIASCLDGFADCDGNAANGCEVTLGTASNCTRCGDACSGSTPVCGGRAAGCASGCTGSTVRCAMDCVDVTTSSAHCGRCNNACVLPNATSSRCEGAVCRPTTCAAGFGDCDGNPLNGCETDLRTSTTHCGACGAGCAPPNATARCSMGMCSFSSCNAGFADCDRIVSNGCETNTNTSITHCGACNAACTPSNATAVCSGGSCGYGVCSAGFANCDGVARNGCEVDTRISLTNCGACRVDCRRPHASTTCESSACVLGACDPGFGNCNMIAADGCEADFATSVLHCGGCGNACLSRPNSTPLCASAACTFRCVAGTGDCNAMPADGCESLLNDLGNCGACGRTCALANATASCSTKACLIVSCDPGFADCNGRPADGCETPLGTAMHCLSCGNACTAAQTCTSAGCRP